MDWESELVCGDTGILWHVLGLLLGFVSVVSLGLLF